jgi:voltage-gated potassium channel Kch
VDELRAVARHHGFGIVLVLVLASVSFQVAAPSADWSILVTVVLGALTLLVSAWAARSTRPIVRGAALIAVLLALFAFGVLIVEGDVPKSTGAVVNGLLVAFAPAVLAAGLVRDLREARAVTVRTLSGVLAIYLLLGMTFSFLDGAAAAFGSEPFFDGAVHANRSDFLYFSYVTLSTTGYGDLAPATDVGRMLAVAEALIGQIYLVTVVALIVGNLRPRSQLQP